MNWGGHNIEAILDHAPGNHAPIGGIKLTTGSAWVAARPSGTEDIYKIYGESFRSEEHLKAILKQAQSVVVGRKYPTTRGRMEELYSNTSTRPMLRTGRKVIESGSGLRYRSDTGSSAPQWRPVSPVMPPCAALSHGRAVVAIATLRALANGMARKAVAALRGSCTDSRTLDHGNR